MNRQIQFGSRQIQFPRQSNQVWSQTKPVFLTHVKTLCRSAQAIQLSPLLPGSPEVEQTLLKETVYDKIVEEADTLLELLTKFNQSELAQRQMSGIRSVAYARAAAGTRLDRDTMDQACKALHEWLSKESPLRSFLAYLAGESCYWSAYAHERPIRRFIMAGQGSKDDLLEAVTSRTAGSDGAGANSGTASMSALDRIG